MRDALEHDLDFTPGERFAYSNVGYCILGRVIERVSGERYESFVRNLILKPSGTEGLRLGRTLTPAAGEVTYYDFPGKAAPGFGIGTVPGPYGTLPLEMMDSYGAWIGSASDILRFFLAIDGAKGSALLQPASLREMRARPAITGQKSVDMPKTYYGLGIEVTTVAGINWWHDGLQPGVMSLALRTADGYAWVVLFNSRPEDNHAFFADFDKALWNAKAKVTRWPEGDLFADEKISN
ncbi:MAG TPA: serine hydrolase domain-containing protein [Rhodocyclaceae bacterium]|nr:serine hydrolase domain-containing protein [Rhodocyclaceae bacterium]